MKTFILVLLLALSSSAYAADAPESDEASARRSFEPAWPMVVGAGAISWGAYALGHDKNEGRRNVGILWGGAVLVAVSFKIQQHYFPNKKLALNVEPSANDGVMLAARISF